MSKSSNNLPQRLTTFESYVESLPIKAPLRQIDYIFDAEQCLVDCFGKFEQINDDFLNILKKINTRLSQQIVLTKENATLHKSYREYYSDRTKRIVEEIFWEDICYFGYSF